MSAWTETALHKTDRACPLFTWNVTAHLTTVWTAQRTTSAVSRARRITLCLLKNGVLMATVDGAAKPWVGSTTDHVWSLEEIAGLLNNAEADTRRGQLKVS